MTAKEARERVAQNKALGTRAAELLKTARFVIEKAVNAEECKVSNIFAGFCGQSIEDIEKVYAILESEGYTISRLGDCNVTISW